MELVQGRECGECTVCCTVHGFRFNDSNKLPGIACQHLSQGSAGCSIHASKYPHCRAYHCAWRFMAGLGEGWRPDRSHVLVDFQNENLPPQYPNHPGIRLTLAGPRETVFNPAFIDFVRQLVANEVPSFLSVPGPPGYLPVTGFLNDALKAAVDGGDLDQIRAFFTEVLARLEHHEFSPAPTS